VKVTALAAHTPEAVRAALAARGWEPEPAWFTATGVRRMVVLLDELNDTEREALVHWSVRAGADLVSGDGWALVATAASRLAPLGRPERVPEALAALAPAFAEFVGAHAEPGRRWRVRGADLDLTRPLLIGILNVTPDSFSDGGRFTTHDAALAHAERLAADGAGMLDVGGESTRPGAAPLDAATEIERVVPVVRALAGRGGPPVSVDTRRAAVARAALDAGAVAVNDVSALGHDAEMAAVVARAGAGVILMHMRGDPATMDRLAVYRHVASEVATELGAAAGRAVAAGIAREAIMVDPGFGFAKTVEQNFRLLDELATIVGLGYPVAVGPSRKRFLGAATGRPVADRDRATALACAFAWERGARAFRVHDVALTREALMLATALTDPA
jgi:dihydropteroate synthase